MVLKQALVDGSKFLGTHVAVVYPGENLLVAKVAQVPHCLKQILVLNRSTVEVGTVAA